jgi:hypothetical protein
MTLGDEIRRRYPRLIGSMRRAGALSEVDAVCALVEYKVFGIRDEFAAEAIARLGGQLAAIRHGIRYRHASPSAR